MTAHIIPYKEKEGHLYFFLQKRSMNAERHPGAISIFGGGLEAGELHEDAMLRESREELSFIPTEYVYVGEYSGDFSVSHYYTTEVTDDNEEKIVVREGDYGVFLSEEEVGAEELLSAHNKIILKEVAQKIKDGSFDT